jgi:hypothetical protein
LPGTVLSRKWKRRTLLVEVLSNGFRYESRHYASLSAIAVAVTGTGWKAGARAAESAGATDLNA